MNILAQAATDESDAVKMASDLAGLVVIVGLVLAMVCLGAAVWAWVADKPVRDETKKAVKAAATKVEQTAVGSTATAEEAALVQAQSVAVDAIMEAASKLATSFEKLAFSGQLLIASLVFFGIAVAGAFAGSIAAVAAP